MSGEIFIDPAAEKISAGISVPDIESLYESRIAQAKKGDRDSARWLLQSVVSAVRQNTGPDGAPLRKPSGTATQLPETLIRHLSESFAKILDGVDPAVALCLKDGGPGRPSARKDELAQRNYEVCLKILRYRKEHGMTYKDAQVAAAGTMRLSKDTVIKIWKNNKAARYAALVTMRWNCQEG